ncbi:MAG: phosphotransferase family protein, partial [Chlamydiia bacterium]
LRAIIAQAFPQDELQSLKIVSGGCANLNVRVDLSEHKEPLLLRLYVRDADAVHRERRIAELIGSRVPVPRVYSVGEYGSYRYAIVEFVQGRSLRDLILRHAGFPMEEVLAECGRLLARLQEFSFPHSGFFDGELNVLEPLSREGFLALVEECLRNDDVRRTLGLEVTQEISNAVHRHKDLIPDPMQHTLVHGDFDPANILVQQVGSVWQVSAILDWEFAFSGPWLCDVANMLRYAHRVPPVFEKAFLSGLQEAGVPLPDGWRITTDLSNLFSLLDCLARGAQPRQAHDIVGLIRELVARLR